MRVLKSELAKFLPHLNQLTDEAVALYLTNLGFETELLEGRKSILEVKITPNRADAMSHLGLARDLAALLAFHQKLPSHLVLDRSIDNFDKLLEYQDFVIQYDPHLTSQYHAIIFDRVSIGPSPQWLQDILSLLGLRPINNIVDLTNYLMEIYGQPLHAFDLDKIIGDQISIRKSRAKEKLITLDDKEQVLDDQAIVIEDQKDLIDLAGIMGGKNSEITSKTKRVLLQSAIFNSKNIRATSHKLNHRTAASVRYERGIDPSISLKVLKSFIDLVSKKEFGQAKTVGKIFLDTKKPSKTQTITYQPTDLNHLIGVKIVSGDQQQILSLLGCQITTKNGLLEVTPPPWRFDLKIWQDLAEEIVRIVGLNQNISSRLIKSKKVSRGQSLWQAAEALKDILTDLGLSEVYTYSFISKTDLERLELPKTDELINPLNPDLKFLRPSLMPGLVKVIAQNSLIDPILIFEIGHVFVDKNEAIYLGISLASSSLKMENIISQLAAALQIDSAKILGKFRIQILDELTKLAYKIRRKNVVIAEINLKDLLSTRNIPHDFRIPLGFATYHSISKFPPVAYDVALIVDQKISADHIIKMIREFHGWIENAFLFDEYTHQNLGKNKKSLAFHIFYSDPASTLTQKQIETIHQELLKALEKSFSAQIR